MLEKDAKQSGTQKVKFNRLKANKFVQSGKVDTFGEYTIFGQLY